MDKQKANGKEYVVTQEAWKIPLVAEIKKHVSVPVAGCGVIRDPEFADEIIKNGSVDFVAMGRSWLILSGE